MKSCQGMTMVLALGLALQASAHAARADSSHLTVKEWLKGSVTLPGASTPVPLNISILIDVPNLDAYLACPRHEAPVTGVIEMGDMPASLPIREGWCRFFTSSDTAGLKYMSYRMVFDHPERGTLTLFGRKLLHDDRHGTDLWPDSTTLYTEVVPDYVAAPSSDAGAPRPFGPGMGELHIMPLDFAVSVSSIRTPDTHNPLEAARLRAKFGRFFFGEFWGIYGL